MQDGVVLLHGIFRSHLSMRGLASFLKRQGFRVLNLNYPSTKFPLEKLADVIHPAVAAFAAETTGKTHFIGYSMGGLLARAYIHRHRTERLGRVVLVGTPNAGSEVADKFQHWKLYKKLYGPAGQQLITDQSAFADVLGRVDYDVAVIAGSIAFDPISSYMIGKPNDGKVSIESTRVPGMKIHRIIKADHTFFPSYRKMWALALEFLRTGEMS